MPRTLAIALTVLAMLIGAEPARAATATSISVAGDHACALLSDGTVRCWGTNTRGQLGTGDRKRRLTPVAVRGLTDVKAIATDWFVSCALIAGGSVKCWGDNEYGQLGDGTTKRRLTPVTVANLPEAVAIATSHASTCALLADRTVRCWGGNDFGQLGNGTRTASLTPVAVSGLDDVTAISRHNEHACALVTGGTVSCWGWNGGLGPDARAGDQLTPVPVAGVSGVSGIDADAYYTCVVVERGAVECWSAYRKRTVVRGLQNVRAYSWSMDGQQTAHGCALLRDGTVKCHADDSSWGQLGNGSRKRVKGPVTVSGLRGVTMIAAADFHTCALLASGGVRCWGNNSDGVLGDGTTKQRLRPVAVRGLG